MSTPHMLSPEWLSNTLRAIATGNGNKVSADLLEGHISALEAENAAYLHAGRELLAVCTESMPHEEATRRRHNAQFALESPGSGSALLERHGKELVRARNEGLEKAAVLVLARLHIDPAEGLASIRARIIALMESEQ